MPRVVALTLQQRLLYQVFLLLETFLTARQVDPNGHVLDNFIVNILHFYLPENVLRRVVPPTDSSLTFFRHFLRQHFTAAVAADRLRHLFQDICDALMADQLTLQDFEWPTHLAFCSEIMQLIRTLHYCRQIGLRLSALQHNILLQRGGNLRRRQHRQDSRAIILDEHFTGLNLCLRLRHSAARPL